jgi:hypothetical protein
MECLTVIPKAQMQPVLFYGELFLLRRTSEWLKNLDIAGFLHF